MRSLRKFYNAFEGLDTRTNKLLQNPESARIGSMNWRYNFQDELQKSNGFQHKATSSVALSSNLIEYRYNDINTGEKKTEILGVSDDGKLYRKKAHYLKFTGVSSITYSFYYDETLLSYVFKIGSSTVQVSLTMTMTELATALTLATGYTFSVVDDLNATVTSTKLAYLGDVVIDKVVTSKFHSSFFEEEVITPSSEVLFPTTKDYKTNANYDGISYVNANNAVYITDGGFPIKYDGFAAYRAGMPRTVGGSGAFLVRSIDGFSLTQVSTAAGELTNGVYKYYFQYGFIDPNGVEILGKTINPLTIGLIGLSNAVSIQIPPIKHTDLFPVFACKVNVDLTITSASKTISVDSGHNVKAGMVLRIPVNNSPAGYPGVSFYYATVMSVTSTTITLVNPPLNGLLNPESNTYTVLAGQWLNAGYTANENKNIITDIVENLYLNPSVLAGAFVRVYRTKVGAESASRLIDLPVPLDNGLMSPLDTYTYTDYYSDAKLSSIAYSATDGEELPRACKYLTKYQDYIFQAGRPVNTLLIQDYYPTAYDLGLNSWNQLTTSQLIYRYYTESMICDESSVYWNDINSPEGFPQDGLHEFLFETKIQDDEISGMVKNKDVLVVFKRKSTSIMSGDVSQNILSMEEIEQAVGCGSHRSIQDIQGTLIWCDENYGFYSMVAGRLPVFIGYPISDYFRLKKVDARKAVSANFLSESLYFCAIGDKMFVFDYANKNEQQYRACWYLWTNRLTPKTILFSDGILIGDGSVLWKMKTTNTKYDFSDHTSSIPFNYVTSWFTNASPTIDKDFFGIWINSIQGGFSIDVDQYANFIESSIGQYNGLSFKSIANGKLAIKEYINCQLPKLSAISFGFYNNEVNADVKIQGWEIEFSDSYSQTEPRR